MFPGPHADINIQANLGDQGGPVTPPPGSSSLSQPALGLAHTPTGVAPCHAQRNHNVVIVEGLLRDVLEGLARAVEGTTRDSAITMIHTN